MFFFFNDTATTENYTLSLHDALPISQAALEDTRVAALEVVELEPTVPAWHPAHFATLCGQPLDDPHNLEGDRKTTRLNSSHVRIAYAVCCFTQNAISTGAFQLCRASC